MDGAEGKYSKRKITNGNIRILKLWLVCVLRQAVMEMRRVKDAVAFCNGFIFFTLFVLGQSRNKKRKSYRAVKSHVSPNRVCVERWEKERPSPSPRAPPSFVFLTSGKLMAVMTSWSAAPLTGFLPGSLSVLSVCMSFFHTSASTLHLAVCFVRP